MPVHEHRDQAAGGLGADGPAHLRPVGHADSRDANDLVTDPDARLGGRRRRIAFMPYSVSPFRRDQIVRPNPTKNWVAFIPNSLAVAKWPASCSMIDPSR